MACTESFSDDEEGDKFFGELELEDIVQKELEKTKCLNKENREPKVDKLVPVRTPSTSGINKPSFVRQHSRAGVKFNPFLSPIAPVSPAVSVPRVATTTTSVPTKPTSDCEEDEPPKKVFKFRAPGTPPSIVTAEERRRDEEWKTFLKSISGQRRFTDPWFQAIPVTAVTFSQCTTIISLAAGQDTAHLIQLGQLILSFLKEAKSASAEDTSKKIDKKVEAAEVWDIRDTLTLLEMIFKKLEVKIRSSAVLVSPSSENDPKQFFQSVLEEYLAGNWNLDTTKIPEILVRIYPEGFEALMKLAARTGGVNLLVPIGLSCADNLMKILHYFQTDGIEFKSAADRLMQEDPDFEQAHSNSFSKIAVKFVESLMSKIVDLDYFSALPARLQPLFNFECRILQRNSNLLENDYVLLELFNFLDDIFSDCLSTNNGEEHLMKYIISLLPKASVILKDDKYAQRIKYKTCPSLYLALRKCRI